MTTVVIIADPIIFSGVYNGTNDSFRKLIAMQNVHSVLWSGQNDFPSEFMRDYSFRQKICGLINGCKTIKYFRSAYKNNKALLACPTILIDNHAPSLVYGNFDYTININEYKIFDAFNLTEIAKCVCEYVKDWTGQDDFYVQQFEDEQLLAFNKHQRHWAA